MSRKFNRGLSDKLLEDCLHGPCSTILEACEKAGLDIRIRDNYLSVYMSGRSLAKIQGRQRVPHKLLIHHKYIESGQVGAYEGNQGKDYVSFDIDDRFATTYVRHLDRIIARAKKHMGKEEVAELNLLRGNGTTGPVCLFDRQSQVPGTRRTSDLIGVLKGPQPKFVVIEVKRDVDDSLKKVPSQLHGYLEIFDPNGTGLRDDVARSYSTVCEQLRSLRLQAPDPSTITTGMPVVGLVVLVGDKAKPRDLTTAYDCAKKLDRPIHLWEPRGNDSRIPVEARWKPMGR